jgi:hypothetical protein
MHMPHARPGLTASVPACMHAGLAKCAGRALQAPPRCAQRQIRRTHERGQLAQLVVAALEQHGRHERARGRAQERRLAAALVDAGLQHRHQRLHAHQLLQIVPRAEPAMHAAKWRESQWHNSLSTAATTHFFPQGHRYLPSTVSKRAACSQHSDVSSSMGEGL